LVQAQQQLHNHMTVLELVLAQRRIRSRQLEPLRQPKERQRTQRQVQQRHIHNLGQQEPQLLEQLCKSLVRRHQRFDRQGRYLQGQRLRWQQERQ
jgi:hypothetical protein